MPSYTNTLEIDHKPKAIPYRGDGILREDGDANYGFRYVKGDDEALRSIPEVQRDPALLNLIRGINGSETGLFSVGCVSADVEDERGFRRSGYVEFSINSISGIANAANYFPIYFHFDRLLHESKFSVAVAYAWELQPCTFTEADGASGFSCSVIVNTHYFASREQASLAWKQALEPLEHLLSSVPPETTDFLYPQ
ncbi:hypothetical protein [Piscinibacter gummiphilus]|uniref:Uncharacterized protein n=1 Tax=Piscinibacter gummiphilus TaxID=946333 RepID=A0ABZ0CPR8_9BURK|nr:hypothetical protein [Piscinibacter gummiphilus]WOB06950.1 hypothetical protein RXV79_18730 [Piscinibacter gummiphilus]